MATYLNRPLLLPVLMSVSILAMPVLNTKSVDVLMGVLSPDNPVVSYSDPNPVLHLDGFKLTFEPYREAFEDFKKKNDIRYSTEVEEAYRFSIFKHNAQRIEKHNLQYHRGLQSFYQNVNQFADKTLEEVRVYNRLGRYAYRRRLTRNEVNASICRRFKPENVKSDPQSVDWRLNGKVTGVKNQADCGSCWTFSATGAIEGSFAIRTGRLVSFSEQQIVDCCHGEGCLGCNGGFMDNAFSFVNRTGGLESEKDYNYTAKDGSCRYDRSQVKVHVTGCADIRSWDEVALRNAVARHGPVSVAIDANHDLFINYGGGIYYNEKCNSTVLDHGVLAVGYGSQNGHDYWIVKNSWGSDWGENGYVRMARNKNNNCGIATNSSFPFTAMP